MAPKYLCVRYWSEKELTDKISSPEFGNIVPSTSQVLAKAK